MIRNLSESTTEPEPEPILWQMIYTLIVMFGMFLFLILDTAGADMIMVGTLTLFMVSGIVTINSNVFIHCSSRSRAYRCIGLVHG